MDGNTVQNSALRGNKNEAEIDNEKSAASSPTEELVGALPKGTVPNALMKILGKPWPFDNVTMQFECPHLYRGPHRLR